MGDCFRKIWLNGSPCADRIILLLKKTSVQFGMQKATAKQGKTSF